METTYPRIEIEIFDTTMRDGDQAESIHHQIPAGQKLGIAEEIASLGVSTIEAGFPATKGDGEEVQQVAEKVGNTSYAFTPVYFEDGEVRRSNTRIMTPVITGLSMAVKSNIEATWDAVQGAAKPGIHVFVPTSDIHIKKKFKGEKDQNDMIAMAIESVNFAHQVSDGQARIEFSCEDASRTDKKFLREIVGEVLQTGHVDVINLPDTVGFAQPNETQDLFAAAAGWIIRSGAADKVAISTHNHDDLGNATANSMAAIIGAIDAAVEYDSPLKIQVEGVIGGRGERAGNVDIAQIVANILVRKDYFGHPVEFAFATDRLLEVSSNVLRLMNLEVPDKAPVIGSEVIKHRSGVHSDAMRKDPRTYAPVDMRGFGHPYVGVNEIAKYQGHSGEEHVQETGGFITQYV